MDGLLNDVVQIQEAVDESGIPNPEPELPIFEELGEPAYVPAIPKTGGLDERKKKKKAVPSAGFKEIMGKIEDGAVDAVEVWPIPEPFWPSQSQQVVILLFFPPSSSSFFSSFFSFFSY